MRTITHTVYDGNHSHNILTCQLLLALTADCRDDKDIKKQFRRQNAVGNMLVRKFSFAPIEAKLQLFKLYCYPVYGYVLFGVILT